MKKALCMVLVLLMAFATVATAEGFSLRNGIQFGDTMEEVLAKETLEIDSINDGSSSGAEATDAVEGAAAEAEAPAEEAPAEEDEEEPQGKYPYSIETKEDTVAGIAGSYILYQFDANKTLRNVEYYFNTSTSRDSVDDDYDNVNEGLIRKYGSALGYTNGSCYIVTGTALEHAVSMAYLFEQLDAYGDLRDYDEWDVDAGDYHVKIEHVEYYIGISYSELLYYHMMSYTYFTDEDFNAARQEKSDRQASVDNDI